MLVCTKFKDKIVLRINGLMVKRKVIGCKKKRIIRAIALRTRIRKMISMDGGNNVSKIIVERISDLISVGNGYTINNDFKNSLMLSIVRK